MLSENVIVGFSLITGTISEFILSTYNETSNVLNISLPILLGVSVFLLVIAAIIFSTSNSGYLFNDDKFYSLLLTVAKRTTFDILKYFSFFVLAAIYYYVYLIAREREEVKSWEVVFAGLLMVVVYIIFLWLFTHNNKEKRKIERNTISNLLHESKTINVFFPIVIYFSAYFFSLSILIAIYGFVFDIISWLLLEVINIWINLFRVVFVLLAFSFPWLKKLLYKYESNGYVSYGEIIIPITATLRIGNLDSSFKTPTEPKDQTVEELKPIYKEKNIIFDKGEGKKIYQEEKQTMSIVKENKVSLLLDDCNGEYLYLKVLVESDLPQVELFLRCSIDLLSEGKTILTQVIKPAINHEEKNIRIKYNFSSEFGFKIFLYDSGSYNNKIAESCYRRWRNKNGIWEPHSTDFNDVNLINKREKWINELAEADWRVINNQETKKEEFAMEGSYSYENLDKSDEGKKLRQELIRFQSMMPGVPPLPTQSLKYEGWFKEIKKHMERTKITRSINEQTEIYSVYNNLYKVYVGLLSTFVDGQNKFNELILAKEEGRLIPLKLKEKEKEILANISKHDLAIAESEAKIKELQNPKQPQQTSIREQKEEEVELEEIELRLVKIKAEIDKIKNPSKKTSIADPIINISRDIKEITEAKNREIEIARKEGRSEDEIKRISNLFDKKIYGLMEKNK